MDGKRLSPTLTLGLLGHNRIESGDLAAMTRAMPDLLRPFVQSRAERAILLTPLALGADVALTELASALLHQHGVQSEVVVVRTLPMAAMIADSPPGGGLAEWLDASMHRILQDPSTTIVDAMSGDPEPSTWSGPANRRRRQRGYRRANTYIALHADLLIAYFDRVRNRPEGASGGTLDALECARRLAKRRGRSGESRPAIALITPIPTAENT